MPRPREIDPQLVRALRAAGLLWKQIEHQLGCTRQACWTALRRELFDIKPLERRPPRGVISRSRADHSLLGG